MNYPDVAQHLHDLEPSLDEFQTAVYAGLSQKNKTLPCKFFYDSEGSRLFESICEQPEYYPTRTECALLQQHAGDIARHLGPQARLIEFGSGAGYKIRLLLRAMQQPAAYIPVDISRAHLLAAASELSRDFPQLSIVPVCADYTEAFDLPTLQQTARSQVGFFPGSTIGNFTPLEARLFLSGTRHLLGAQAYMLIGVDLRKDSAVLEAAYNDTAGVTAAFNLNLLRRINRELGGRFDLADFAHRAVWNADLSRIEMHLVSLRRQTVQIGARRFNFSGGETIHTENSYKYSVRQFQQLADEAGYTALACWTDSEARFSVHLLRAV